MTQWLAQGYATGRTPPAEGIPEFCSAHKYLHVALQTASGIFIILGLVFIGLFKRYNGEAQFFSVHSWLGAIAIAAYIAQYTAGETPRLCSSSRLRVLMQTCC